MKLIWRRDFFLVRHAFREGFALFVSFLILALLLVLGVSLLNFVKGDGRLLEVSRERKFSEIALCSAARLVWGDLQFFAGTDSVVLAPSGYDDAREGWLAVWGVKHAPFSHSENLPLKLPLVSNFGEKTGTGVYWFKNLRSSAGEKGWVPWQYFGERERLAYFVSDDSQKIPFNALGKMSIGEGLSMREEQEFFQVYGGRSESSRFFLQEAGLSLDELTELLRFGAYSPGVFFGASPEGLRALELFSAGTFSVPIDLFRGGLKRNLLYGDFGDSVFTSDFIRECLFVDRDFQDLGMPIDTERGEPYGECALREAFFPLITDLRLHVGFFNARSDGQHRARFHITAKYWNPYAFPLLAQGDGNIALIDYSALPEVQVQNLDTKAEFVVPFSDFPRKRFGLVSQTASDKTFNAYGKIFDLASPVAGPGSNVGFFPGEVFLARYPNPEGQPSGLSRIAGGATWKYQKKESSLKPPAGTQGNRWFHPRHRIRIIGMPSLFPSEVLLRAYRGALGRDTFPENYSEALGGFRNLNFPAFFLEMSGEDYNRAKAGDYSIEQANVVYRIRLKTEDSRAMENFFREFDWRVGVLDFEEKFVADAFEVSVHVGEEARRLAKAESEAGEELFFDRKINAHAPEENDSFACIPFFEKPFGRFISPIALRYFLCERGGVAGTAGNTGPQNQDLWLDAYPFLMRKGGNASDAFLEREFMFKMQGGMFNLNSTRSETWEAILSNSLDDWRRYFDKGENVHIEMQRENLKNAVFVRPFSAHKFFYGSGTKIFSDEALAKFPRGVRERLLCSQGVRILSAEKLEKMAREVAIRIEKRLRAGTPFWKLSDFASSGILEEAIEIAGINEFNGECVPAWFPGAVKPIHFLQLIAHRTMPRGDTLRARLRVEVLNPMTRQIESAIGAEICFQRESELFDSTQDAGTPIEEQNAVNRAFGRRFKVREFKFLSHDD